MKAVRFEEIASRFAGLRVGVLGDFCLDRYLEIDPARTEVSIETGLPVYNVTRVRAQPGAAGTVLQNLVGLGVGELYAIGFCGDDGEGFELRRALAQLPGVHLEHFLVCEDRKTFTYAKPLLIHPHAPPEELSRLDTKNWSATSQEAQEELAQRVSAIVPELDALLVLEQVDDPATGVATPFVREAIAAASRERLIVVADSRAGLSGYPDFVFKMNLAELSALSGSAEPLSREGAGQAARKLAAAKKQPVFVTMAEQGILCASHGSEAVEYVLSHPLRGPIDIVGAGDSVSATLGGALAAGATVREAMELAMAAASLVIHELGSTGRATIAGLRGLLCLS